MADSEKYTSLQHCSVYDRTICFLLKNILQNKQTLHLFTRILKQNVFTKFILNAKLEGLGRETYQFN